MKILYTKITSFIIILLTAFPLLTTLILQEHQKTIRHQIKERLEKQQLHIISVKQENVLWAKAGKEIWLGGRMFDIKTSRLKDGYYTFTGLFDEEETALVKQLQHHQQEQNKSGNKVLVQLFQLLQAHCDNLREEPAFVTENAGTAYGNKDYHLFSSFLSIITPPPRC